MAVLFQYHGDLSCMLNNGVRNGAHSVHIHQKDIEDAYLNLKRDIKEVNVTRDGNI